MRLYMYKNTVFSFSLFQKLLSFHSKPITVATEATDALQYRINPNIHQTEKATIESTLFVPPSKLSVFVSLSLSVSLSLCLYVSVSVCLSLFLCHCLSLCLCLYVSLCVAVSLSLCLRISVTVFLSLCLCFCVSVSL